MIYYIRSLDGTVLERARDLGEAFSKLNKYRGAEVQII